MRLLTAKKYGWFKLLLPVQVSPTCNPFIQQVLKVTSASPFVHSQEPKNKVSIELEEKKDLYCMDFIIR